MKVLFGILLHAIVDNEVLNGYQIFNAHICVHVKAVLYLYL